MSDVAVVRRTADVRPSRRGRTSAVRCTHVRAAAVDGYVLCANGEMPIKNGKVPCRNGKGAEKKRKRGGIAAGVDFAAKPVLFIFFPAGDKNEEPAKPFSKVWRILLHGGNTKSVQRPYGARTAYVHHTYAVRTPFLLFIGQPYRF